MSNPFDEFIGKRYLPGPESAHRQSAYCGQASPKPSRRIRSNEESEHAKTTPIQKIFSERVILGSNHLFGGRLGEGLDSLTSFVRLLSPSLGDCLQCRPRAVILHARDDVRKFLPSGQQPNYSHLAFAYLQITS